MARVVEGDAHTGTWARPSTPQMEMNSEGQFVSRGWNELEHKGWVFKAKVRPPSGDASLSGLRDALALGPVPLPERVSAENVLELVHVDSAVKIEFTAAEALAGWHSAQQQEFGGRLSAQEYDRNYNTPYSGSIVVTIHVPAPISLCLRTCLACRPLPSSRNPVNPRMPPAQVNRDALREKLRVARKIEAPDFGKPGEAPR